MQLVQILLPLTDNEGQPFPSEMFEALKDDLTKQYQGVTAFVQTPAQGRWAGDGSGAAEDIAIFEVMVEKLDAADWQARRQQLETVFRQERIVIRYMSIGLV